MSQTDSHVEALTKARIDIASLEVEVGHMKVSIDQLRESNRELVSMVADIQKTLAEARGGWRTLMMIGGASGSIGAGALWLFQHFTKG